ncbi:uncharacterized protein BXZ73DRAFT_102495 [Epithele typhae]|uniref:uncharacterized protein n=1 Tax=Epithele typhae TaxID=378194 RepID=UPI002007370A|nr:uncharacterized protein BXZ73DRAFT_102495 [Epithele typhae]KAH9927987.1 hypothetical protein BXZ73DRAFT_102495 [Epithele typhae]
MNTTRRPRLNDDIMYLIFPYIDTSNMAMTSSHMYGFVFSHRFADEFIGAGRRGKARAEFLLQRDPLLDTVRASNIRRLIVMGPHNETIDFATHILPVIQHSAVKLRSLSVGTSQKDAFNRDPRLLAAITTMPKLISLYLSLDPTLFSHLSNFPSDTAIEILYLVFSGPADDLHHVTFSAFVTTLARFPRLRDLVFGFLDLLLGPVNPIAPPGLAPLPSLVSLTLRDRSTVALPLCPLCPRLSSLRCESGQVESSAIASELEPYTGPRWPSIRSLSLSVPHDAPLLVHWPVANRVASGSAGVARVHIERWRADARTLDAESDVVEAIGLPQLLPAMKPVALVLDILPSTAPAPVSTTPEWFPEPTWLAIASAQLRLRSLDLTIGGHAPRDDLVPIVPCVLCTALAGLPLVHLAIEECAHYTDAGFPVSYAAELARVRRLLGAPRALVDVLRSVCVVQVRGACPAVLPRTAEEVGEQEEAEAAALAELRRIEKEGVQRRERWWWAEDVVGAAGSECELVELWREDGERAREIVEREDFDAKTSFDGFMLPKCIYRP